MELKKEVMKFLNDLDATHFIESTLSGCENIIIGSIKGQFISMLVIDANRRPTMAEMKLVRKVCHTGGEHYEVRSMEDVTELSKLRGWYD